MPLTGHDALFLPTVTLLTTISACGVLCQAIAVLLRVIPSTSAVPAQVSCSWGFTTTGGAKGVGESTTSAVVISLVLIFIADFFLSFLFFQGAGDALKQLK